MISSLVYDALDIPNSGEISLLSSLRPESPDFDLSLLSGKFRIIKHIIASVMAAVADKAQKAADAERPGE